MMNFTDQININFKNIINFPKKPDIGS